MKAVHQLRRLASNNAWSNHRILGACAKLDAAAYEAPGVSFFRSIPATLNHILIVDWYYLDGLERGGRGRACFDDELPFPDRASLEELSGAQHHVDRRLVAFTERLSSDATLDETVTLQRRDGPREETVGDILLHLFTHQTHHRGQVHAMLSGTAVKPPQLDEFFMRGAISLREGELMELGLPLE